MVRVSYPLQLTVAAGAKNRIPVVTVPNGRVFRLRKVTVHFPPGTEYKLQIRVVKGIYNVVPRSGYLTGDDTTYSVEADEEYSAGSQVVVEYVNQDTVESKSCFILIEGEMT